MLYFIGKVGENIAEVITIPGEDFGRDKMKKWKAVLLHTQEWGRGHGQCWWVLGSGHKPPPGDTVQRVPQLPCHLSLLTAPAGLQMGELHAGEM